MGKAVKNIKNRNMIIIAGDMNAKTGSSNKDYPECVGRYGKGETNSSGECLVEFALQNEMFLTQNFHIRCVIVPHGLDQNDTNNLKTKMAKLE